MTANQFNQECALRTIDPDIAIENSNIQEGLRLMDDEYVIEILDLEF